jgi:transglutaminase-like putative cysteine protease
MREHPGHIYPILFALIVSILPHVNRLPLWIILWCAGMWGYTLLSFRYKWPWPKKSIRLVLSAIGIVGLLLTFTSRHGQGVYLGLLAVMAALKPFEISSHRDRMITLFLAYFIVITSLFQSESLSITLYMFISVGITTAALIRINDPYGRFKANLKLSGLIMAQAIPLMILLFILFPRIQGSLFGLSLSQTGKSGFSDRLNPGSVASLAKNDEVAFRAEFDGPMPPPHLRYWRGIVFQNFDGRRWLREKWIPEAKAPPAGENPVSYTVTLEPHHDRWLFALEMPADIPRSATLFRDDTLRSRRRVTRKMRYSLTSNTRYRTEDENQFQLRRLTDLPDDVNLKARNLAKQLTENAVDVDEKIARVLDYFKQNGFVYTLKPPLLGKHPVDDFLFQSRQGYCEHYASAFAFMMRAVDIPARIVGGYLGGEVNPYADYLIIRQSDAHVWVEIWHPENGWYRVDPTIAVAPDRISGGLEGALPDSDLSHFFAGKYFGSLSGFLKQLQLRWDAVSTKWIAWFSGYAYYEQKALLEKIGISFGSWISSFKALLLGLMLAGVIIGIYAFFVLKSPREKSDAVKKNYARFCEKLARAGLARNPHMGPLDYVNYVSKNRPDLKTSASGITNLYIQLRYQKNPSKESLKKLIEKVSAFKPVQK